MRGNKNIILGLGNKLENVSRLSTERKPKTTLVLGTRMSQKQAYFYHGIPESFQN